MKGTALPPRDIPNDLWTFLGQTERPILLYGMGNGADKLIARLALLGKEVADVFASDGFVRGQLFHGKRVLSFSEAKEKYEAPIILVSFGTALSDVLQAIFAIEAEYELYVPDMPIAGDAYFTKEFYAENYDKFLRAYDILADDASKALYANLLWYKLTGKPQYLRNAVKTGDERELLGYESMRCAVDVGAYRGDTLAELLSYAPFLQTVFLFEPDVKNFKKLSAYAEGIGGKELILRHAAAWNENGILSFSSSGNRNATLDVDHLAGTASFEHRTTAVEAVKIDDIIQGRMVDYIKYDTEGAEMAALLGSLETIESARPALKVSVYHRSEDLFALPLLLWEKTENKYTYYLRRRLSIPAWDIELIAVPNNKERKE